MILAHIFVYVRSHDFYHTGPKMAISLSIIAFLVMSMREDIYAKEQSCTCTRLTRAQPKMDPQEVHQG